MSERTKTILKFCALLAIPLLVFYAMLYPIIGEVRENAHTTSCRDNLRKLGTAFMQYSQENDGMMPNIADRTGANTWRDATLPYVKIREVYHCPSRRDDVGAGGFSQNYAANYSGDYGRTQPDRGKGALAGSGSIPLSRQDYSDPSKLILLLEPENNSRPEFNIDDSALFGPQTHTLWAGHFRRHGNFLMADGHVKSWEPSATYLYDPKNHSLLNLWYRNSDTRLSANRAAVLKDAKTRFK